ncbi:RHS repeat domain-containing protein, partial [Mucilaginibacter flavus]|uniref:RHS repeat domain-containing protein n=1 Tax=Mucilaginibacter flavus TaxID=931504 RepID=UPI0025B51043
DANQRGTANQQWTVTKYDQQGRIAVTGLYTDAGSVTGVEKRTDMQTSVTGNPGLWEATVAGGNGYSTAAGVYATYPKTLNTTLGINYYDNYAVPSLPSVFDKHTETGMSTMTRGLPTASLVKVLDGSTGSNNMLWSVNYYDDFGRGIRGFSEHFKGGMVSVNNYDEVKSTYDFTAAVQTSSRVNYVNSSSNTAAQSVAVTLSYSYDHMGRKLTTQQNINGNTILLNSYAYNEIGQVSEKNLHSTDNGQTFLQSVDYRYNSRGWLKSINNAALNNADPLINNDTNDAFGEEISYDDYGTTALKQYNGNISAVSWQGKKQPSGAAAQIVQSYEYNYDKLNRLTLANYTTAGLTGRYNESLTYDVAGNIKKLNRYRDISNAATPIDQLTYVYDNSDNSSRLLSVTDGSGSNEGQLNGTTGYTYDSNGNLWVDNKKGLTFTYNYLNLPYTVTPATGNALTYVYDAAGRKLRKVISGGNHDYVNGIEYDASGNILFLATEEGRARPNAGSYFYEYALKDHLGNTRVLIGQDGQVAQQTDYYAFGMEMNRGGMVAPNPDNKYKYNGKEMQDDLAINLYDYGARFYDPVLGRWTAIDPMAEKYPRLSAYNYGVNNPIRFIDPNGMDVYSDDRQQDANRTNNEDAEKEKVGADGLTDSQWMASSSTLADPDLADYFVRQNANDEKDKKDKEKGYINKKPIWYMPWIMESEYVKGSDYVNISSINMNDRETTETPWTVDLATTKLLQTDIGLTIGKLTKAGTAVFEGFGKYQIGSSRAFDAAGVIVALNLFDLVYRYQDVTISVAAEKWYGKVQFNGINGHVTAIQYSGSEKTRVAILTMRIEQIYDSVSQKVWYENKVVYPVKAPSASQLPKFNYGQFKK